MIDARPILLAFALAMPVCCQSTATATGIVLLPDGSPAAGATIELRRNLLADTNALDLDRPWSKPVTITCGEDGTFACELPVGLPHELCATAGGSAIAVAPRVYAGEKLTLQLERPAMVEGVVTDSDGSVVAGATARIHQGESGTRTQVTATDSAGHYAATLLLAGRASIEIHPVDGKPEDYVRVVLSSGRTVRCDVRLAAGERVEGRVVDARTKAAIAGAEVAAEWPFEVTVRTDAEGHFALRRGDGGQELHARAPGYGRLAVRGAGAGPHTIELLPARRVRGVVVDASNRPIAGVYVAATASHDAGMQQIDWVATRTGADGTFQLDARADVPHCLFLRADGLGTLVYDFPDDERRADAIDFGRIAMRPAIYLTGRVLDENGAPVVGAPVWCKGTNRDRGRFGGGDGSTVRGSFYVNGRSTYTDSLGRWHLADVAAGNYEIGARAEEVTPRLVGTVVVEAAPFRARIDGSAPMVQHDFAVTLGRTLRGRVIMPSGGTVPDSIVTLEEADTGRVPLLLHRRESFWMLALPQGDLTLGVGPSDLSGKPTTLAGVMAATRRGVRTDRGVVTLCLGEAGWVQAFVVDEHGAPVQGARVTAGDAHDQVVAERTTDRYGSAALAVGTVDVVTLVVRRSGAGAGQVDARSDKVATGTSNLVLVVK